MQTDEGASEVPPPRGKKAVSFWELAVAATQSVASAYATDCA